MSPKRLPPVLSSILAFAAGIGLRLWLTTTNQGLTMDSPLYVRMAEGLSSGATALGPAHHAYPALMALAGLVVPGGEWPGRAVSLAAGIALLGVVYGLARRQLSPGWASLAVWLVALHPLAAVYSGAIMTESVAVLAIYGAILLAERARPAWAGAMLGLGYATRPDAWVVAPAVLLARRGSGGRARDVLLAMAGLLAVTLPYLGYLRWERGSWMLTPKMALVRPQFEDWRDAEWSLGPGDAPVAPEPRGFAERASWSASSVARNYPGNLLRHLNRVVQAWPWPVLALSLWGITRRRGPLLGALAFPFALPLLAVPYEIRFALLPMPALAVLAAEGASAIATRAQRIPRAGLIAIGVALGGLVWSWWTPAGARARVFDDGPMEEMRAAGAWLRRHGQPGDLVMDRKSFVAFFAGMRHIQLPNDDYETLIAFARREGVDYLVIEEYLVKSLRPQLLPLVDDREFRQRERRLRLVFATGRVAPSGIAVFEMVPEEKPLQSGG